MNTLAKLLQNLFHPVLRLFRLVAITVAMIGLSFGSMPLMAADQTWDGSTDGAWSDPDNWVGGAVPSSTDIATFDSAGGTIDLIDLGGTLLSGGITFTSGSAVSYIIGIAGVDTLNLTQSDDNVGSNDADIIIASSVMNNQTIAADILLGDGDGAGADGFTDQIEFQSNSLNADLIVNGAIATGTGGATLGGNQRLFLSGVGDIELNGDFNETTVATSAAFISLFVSNTGTTTFSGTNNATTDNYLRFTLQNGTTLEVTGAANSLGAGPNGSGFLDIRYGTIELNQDQIIGNNVNFGHANQANGTSTLNIGAGNTVTLSSNINYLADDGTANTATVAGGTLLLDAARTITVADNALVTGTDAELTISSDFNSTGSFTITKGGAGTLRLAGNNSASNNGINVIDVRAGTVQFTLDENLGDNDVFLGRNAVTGTLEHVGEAGVTDNQVRIGRDSTTATYVGGGIILSNGTGAVVFSNASTNEQIRQDAGIIRNLTLGGSNTGDNIISGRIRNNESADNSNNELGVVELTKEGTGTWILNGASTYTGDTDINEGRLDIGGSVTSDINVANGANLGGEGTTSVTGIATLTGGGNIVFGDGTGSANLNVNGYTSAALTADVDIDTSFGVNVIVDQSGAGAFTVINYGTWNGADGNGGVDISNFTTTATTSSRVVSAEFSGATLNKITLDLGFETRTWDNGVISTTGGDSLWNTTSTNWEEGDFLFVEGDHVIFDGTATGTINLGADVAPGSITFNPAGGSFTISPSASETLTVGSGGLNFMGNAGADDVTINVELVGGGTITRSGGAATNVGQVFITNDNSAFTGVTVIEKGDLQINHVNALGNDSTNTITISDGGDDGQLIINAEGTVVNDIIISATGGTKNIRFDNGGNNDAKAVTLSGNIQMNETSSALNFAAEGLRQNGDIGGTTSGNSDTPTHVLTIDGLITSGILSADGPIQKSDQGVLILNNANNDFTGALYVNQGTVKVASIGNIGEASHAGAARADLTTGHIRLGNGNNADPDLNSGTLIYTGAGAESTDRTVRIGASSNSSTASNGGGTIANNGGGALTFTNATFNDIEDSNATRISARTLTLAGTYTGINEIEGVIADNLTTVTDDETVGITVDTDGTWYLSATNTYTGKTTVNGGTLRIDNEEALGANPGLGGVIADQLILASGGTLNTTASFTIDDTNRGITVSGGSIDADTSTTLQIDSIIAGTTLNLTGAGIVDFNATNTFTGLNVDAGTARALVATSAFGTDSAVTVASGATLDLGISQTIGSLTGAGTVTNTSGGGVTLTLGGSGTSTTSGTTIQDGAGILALDNLSGTHTLASDVTATYTGGTTVTGGQLNIDTTVLNTITVADGATLGGEGSTNSLLTLGDGLGVSAAILSVDGSTAGAFISAGLVTNTTNGLIVLNFSAPPLGVAPFTALTYGGGAGAGTFGGDFTIGTGLTLSGRGGSITDNMTDIIVTTGFETKTWNATFDSVWNEGGTSTANWLGGDTLFYDGDFVIFDDTPAAAQTITLTDAIGLAPTDVTFNNTGTNTYTFSAAATETLTATGGITLSALNTAAVTFDATTVITGATAITHSGSGVLTLAGANTYSGATTLNSGTTTISGDNNTRSGTTELNSTATLNIDNANALGSGTLDINGGTIDVSAGAIVNAGNNAQTWDGDFIFTGSNDLAIGTGAVTLGATRTVTITANELEVGGVISGSGFGITKAGAGTLTLTGTNTFDGGLTVDAGILRAETNTAALGTGTVTLNGGTLALASATNTTFGNNVAVTADSFITADVIPSDGTVAGRTMTMGTLSIGNNTLDYRNGGDISGSGDMVVRFYETTLTGDATFNVQNQDSGSTLRLGRIAGGTNSLTKTGTGLLQLDNVDNVYSGGTTLLRGTLRGMAANAFGSGDISNTGAVGGQTLDLRNNNSAVNNNIIVDDNSALNLNLGANAPTVFNVKNIEISAGRTMNVTANRASSGNNLAHTLNSIGGITFVGAGGSLGALGGNDYDVIIDSATGGIVTTSGTVNFNATSADLTINDVISGGANINFGGANITSAGAEGSIFVNAVNTYTGNTSISHRTDFASPLAAVVLGVDNAFNTTGNLTMNAVGSPDTSTFDMHGFDQTVNALISSGTGIKFITNLDTTRGSLLTIGSNGGSGTFLGTIKDHDDIITNPLALIALTKMGAGTQTLSGTNTYTGGTTVTGGTLALGATDALADTGAVTIDTGGTFDIATFNDTVGQVTLIDGTISGSTGILTTASNYDAQSGTVSAILAGTVGLDKTTAGTVTISSDSTYTGATTVSAGTLDVTGSLDSAITINDGATLSGEGSTDSLLTLGNGGGGGAILSIDTSTEPGAFTSVGLGTNVTAGNITVNGTGIQATGDLTVLDYGAGAFTGLVADFTVGTGINTSSRGAGASFKIVGTAIVLESGVADRTWNNASTDSEWNEGATGSANWVEGDTRFFDNDNVFFNDTYTAANETVTLNNGGATLAVNSMTVTRLAASTKNFTFASTTVADTLTVNDILTIDQGTDNDDVFDVIIAGDGSIYIGDDGTTEDPTSNSVSFNKANTYTGGTTIAEGRVFVRDNAALGTGTITMTDAGTANRDTILDLEADGLTIANDFIIQNPGNNKTIRLDNTGDHTGTITGNIANGESSTRLIFNAGAGDTLTFNTGVISGVGGITKSGSGTVLLSNTSNSFERGIALQNGTLQVASIGDKGVSSAAGAGSNGTNFIMGNSTATGTLEYQGAEASTDRNFIIGDNNATGTRTGGGVINNTGSGTLTFTADAFNVERTLATAARTLTLDGTSDIVISGAIIDNNTSTPGSGNIGVIKDGANTLTLSGDNTYTGATNINAGTLLIDGSTHAGSSVNVLSGGTLGGSGTINGVTTIQSGGSHTAGTTGTGNTGTDASIQTLSGASPGNLNYADGATVTWDLIRNASNNLNTGVAGTDYDQFAITGGGAGLVTFDTNLNFDIIASGTVNFSDSFWNSNLNEWKVWDTGSVEGASGVSITTNIYNGSFSLFEGSQYGGGDTTGIWLVQTAVVPEPSTYAIFGLGLALFGWTARRRRKKAAEVVSE